MSMNELDFKIRHNRNMTDDEWLECYEEYKKLSDEEKQRFKRTIPGHALGNMVAMILARRKKIENIARDLEQQRKSGKIIEQITEKCPRCGNKLLYIQNENSFEIRCVAGDCVSEFFQQL